MAEPFELLLVRYRHYYNRLSSDCKRMEISLTNRNRKNETVPRETLKKGWSK